MTWDESSPFESVETTKNLICSIYPEPFNRARISRTQVMHEYLCDGLTIGAWHAAILKSSSILLTLHCSVTRNRKGRPFSRACFGLISFSYHFPTSSPSWVPDLCITTQTHILREAIFFLFVPGWLGYHCAMPQQLIDHGFQNGLAKELRNAALPCLISTAFVIFSR